MKTKSLKHLATLLGVAVLINASAFAGPGPQPQFQPRKVSDRKVVVVPSEVRTSRGDSKAIIQPAASLTYISGPHGGVFAYRQ